jgi:hypothetical protein
MNWIYKLIEKKYGKSGQYWFYRCLTCQKLVSHKDILNGGCVCGAKRVVPASVTFFEEIYILVSLLWK